MSDLVRDDYWIIPQVLSQDVCELLSDYALFKAELKQQRKSKSDPLQGVHREYGDGMMETLLVKLKSVVEEATGLELWPSLAFYYTYRQGQSLKKHKDRSSCEIVAGICLGADQDFQKQHETWPLFLNVANQSKALALQTGDMVIFRGHQTEHWRELFMGEWFVSAIFAYVDKKGPFAFQKYDQRRSLGLPHIGMFRWAFGSLIHSLIKKR